MSRKRMHRHVELTKCGGKNALAMHRRDLVMKPRSVRVSDKVYQSGLRTAQIQAVDDVEDANQRIFDLGFLISD